MAGELTQCPFGTGPMLRGLGDAREPVLAWRGTVPGAWLEPRHPQPPNAPAPEPAKPQGLGTAVSPGLAPLGPMLPELSLALGCAMAPLSRVANGSWGTWGGYFPPAELCWSEALQRPKHKRRVTPHGRRQQGPGCPGDATPCCPLLRLEGQEELRSIRRFPIRSDPLPRTRQGGPPDRLAARCHGLALAGFPHRYPKMQPPPNPCHWGRWRGTACCPRSGGSGSPGQGGCSTASGVRDLLRTEPAAFPLQSPFPPARSALTPMFLRLRF